MNRSSIALIFCLSWLVLPTCAWARGSTVKIVIEGDSLTAPVEITHPDILSQFSIWNGPGVGGRDPNIPPDFSAYSKPGLPSRQTSHR